MRYIDPCKLIQSRRVNKDLRGLLTDREFLRTIAQDRGLPYSESLEELCKYSSMGPFRLLQHSVKTNDTRVASWLLQHNDFAKDHLDMIAVDSSQEGRSEILQMLLDAGADDYNNFMVHAASYGHANIVRMMLDAGADDYDGAMYEAAREGYIDIVEMLLDAGAEDYNGAMLAAILADVNSVEIVQMMLDLGADDVNEGLVEAAKYGDAKIVKMMLDAGADEYDMAMDEAEAEDHRHIIQILRDAIGRAYRDDPSDDSYDDDLLPPPREGISYVRER